MIGLTPLQAADPQGGLNLEDTHGVAVDRFMLQWDTGSPWNPLNVDSEIFSTLAGMFWVWYRDMVAVQIWVLDWVLGMDWLGYILAPLAGLSIIIQGMIAQIGLLNLMLIILAFVVGFWLLKGRYAGGFMELLIGCVIAALATTFLANPMATIGGDQGVIMQSRNAGMDIATGFATEGASFQRDSTVIRDGLKGQLVNTLLRAPHQIINYGSVIDGTGCEDTYTESVGRENAVDAIGGCDDAYQEAASTVDAGTVVSTLSLLTTGFVFLLLSVVIVGGTIFAVLLLGWSAIKLLWQLPVGVISSGTRAQLFRTFASVGFGCILVAMATMFLVAWMKMLLGFYDATSGLPFLVRLYLFNTLVIAGAVFYVLMGASVRAGLRGLADKLAAAGVPSQVGEPAAMPWDGSAKWRERYTKAKEWAGVGLGPAPVKPHESVVDTDRVDSGPAAMDGTPPGGSVAGGAVAGGVAGAAAGQAASAGNDNATQPIPVDGGTGRDGAAAPGNAWTAAARSVQDGPGGGRAAGGADQPVEGANVGEKPSNEPAPHLPPTAGERLTDRLGSAGRAGTSVALQAGAMVASGGTSAAAVGASRALSVVRRTGQAKQVLAAVRGLGQRGERSQSAARLAASLNAARQPGGAPQTGPQPSAIVHNPGRRQMRGLGRS
ncbi:hypothetical protein ACFQHV_18465 [Promicromonospora thailandica]|uniref:TrbL/VirB6 plasmid conjugal transfer protein n=1 Tax=Promicromonospora thailandica TaxID=765201 RepID=A0A9X2JV44_9MICO|nr:hypothetical protein [Promicromonospora thailandica]MCP2265185.1 hypothetical protein [Promicromonospora thailandica]BFF19738.1 hypothetical protein GCM10025730_32590 [Promicromonospora thailandica]